MKTHHFLIIGIFLLSLSNNLTAQQITWGAEKKLSKGLYQSAYEVLKSDNTGVWVKSKKYQPTAGRPTYIQYFDNQFNLKNEILLNKGFIKGAKHTVTTFFINDVIHNFSSMYNTKNKKLTLVVEQFDKKTLKQLEKLKSLITIQGSGFNRSHPLYGKSNKKARFWITQSPDKSKILIVGRTPNGIKKPYSILVLDNKLRVLWRKDNANQASLNAIIDNRGNIFWMKNNTPIKKLKVQLVGKRKEAIPCDYSLMAYLEEGQTVKECNLGSNKGLCIKDPKTVINDDETIGVIALIGEDDLIKGSFMALVNRKSMEVINKSIEQFSTEFMQKTQEDNIRFFSKDNISDKKVNKMMGKVTSGLSLDYKLKYVKKKNNGEYVLFAEEVTKLIVPVVINQATGDVRMVTKYMLNNVLVLQLDQQGKVKWVNRVNKFHDEDEIYSSFGYLVNNDDVFLLYNDIEFKPMTYKLSLVKIDVNGRMNTQVLEINGKKDLKTRVNLSKQINAKEIILFSDGQKEQHKIGKLLVN